MAQDICQFPPWTTTMDTFRNVLVAVVLLTRGYRAYSQCLSGCSCVADRHGRSLVCMEEGAFGALPENLPHDVTKIRIEKSHFTEIPRGAFSGTPGLENLWLNFNDITVMNSKGLKGLGNLTELRLQGNKLRSVPWTAFEDTPALKILDLKHNRLDVLPEYALRFLPGLTYFDVSFNRLTVVSKEVFLNWPLYRKIHSAGEGQASGFASNVVLALHDNLWLCDCRLKGFVEFVRSLRPPVILMNSYLTCSGPERRAGRFFLEVELGACTKPVAATPFANITAPAGGNITLRCLAKARPEPEVWWTYSLKIIRGFHESQERVAEDTVSSHLVIPSLQLGDRGLYTCAANNFVGNSSAAVLLDVRLPDGSPSSLYPPGGAPPPAAAPPTAEVSVYIDIRIVKQTVRGITVEWYAVLERPADTWFTVHFGRSGSGEKRELISVGPGINSYSVSGLASATKYDMCVTVKNRAPRPGQCVVFMTGSDVTEKEQKEKLIHVLVIVLAMVLAVPVGMYACTTDAKFNCLERVADYWRNRRRERDAAERPLGGGERQGTFDSLQAASDDGLVNRESSEDMKVRRRSEDRPHKVKGDGGRLAAELY